jgi:phytoene dehydrogenase-like protein
MREHSSGALSAAERGRQDARYREGHRYDTLVVGSGMSALALSALLAHAGERVCILEAHDRPGGYVHTFRMGEYRFCAQIHYIWGCGPGDTVHAFLSRLGLADDITFELFDADGYDHVVLPDLRRVRISYGWDRLAREIDRVSPGQEAAVLSFGRLLDRISDEVRRLPDRIRWWDYVTRGWQFLTLLRYRDRTLEQVFDELGLSREARAVLAGNTGNYMCPPEQLSIFAYNGLFSGYNRGAYYPAKHFRYLVDRLVRSITDRPGCHVYYETEVVGFDVDGERVRAVCTADGRTFAAPRIVCNMDPQAASHLIGRERFSRETLAPLSYDYSLTAVTVYLGLRGIDLRDHGFGRHNVWYLGQWDVNRIWRDAMAGDWSRPWMFMATPTLHTPEPGTAPPGGSILELATGASYDAFRRLRQADRRAYLRAKNAVRDRLMDLVEQHFVPGLRRHVVVKVAGSPTTNEAFCMAPRGNSYGQHLTPANMGLGRLRARTPWENFFWCNAASGYPGVNGTIATGMHLYMDLTGDRFFDPSRVPSTRELHTYVQRRLG